MSMNLFDYIKGINNKEYLFDEQSEKEYNAFMINRGFSYFYDTVLLANELNRLQNISNKMRYDFLYHATTKKKRFSKWVKQDKTTDELEIVKEYYNVSYKKAKEMVKLLTSEQIEELGLKIHKGGVAK